MEDAYFKMLVIGICFVILTFASCTAIVNQQDNRATVEMVKAGSDPQKVRCLMRGDLNSGICQILAAK